MDDEYYYNSENVTNSSNGSETMNYYNTDNEIGIASSYSFTVSVKKKMYIIYGLFILFPIVFLYWFLKFLIYAANSGLRNFSDFMVILLIVTVLVGLAFMAEGVGKKIVVVGKSISIRKWFIINDSISLSNVSKCDVTYGITVHSRYGTRTYNRIDLYYDGDKKVSVIDTNYDGWQELVDYMKYNNKYESFDGRTKLQKKLEDWVSKHM